MNSTGAPQGRTTSPLQMVGAVISFLPRFGFSFLRGYLGVKRRANKGSRIFKQQLLKQGMDRRQANELTELYFKPCKVSTYIQMWTS